MLVKHHQQDRTKDINARLEQADMLFDAACNAILIIDLSDVLTALEELRQTDITDFHRYLRTHQDQSDALLSTIQLTEANKAACDLFQTESLSEMAKLSPLACNSAENKTGESFLIALWEHRPAFQMQTHIRTSTERPVSVIISIPIPAQDTRESTASVAMSLIDMSNIRQPQNELLQIAQGIAPETGIPFFKNLVTSLCRALDIDIALVGQINRNVCDGDRVETLAICEKGLLIENFSYDLSDTPCNLVSGGEICAHSQDIQILFPNSHLLKDKNIEAYFGVPLQNTQKETIGLLVLMSHTPQEQAELLELYLKMFAIRVSAELDRLLQQEQISTLSQAIEYSPNVVVITDKKARIEYVNPRFTRVTGYSFAEVVGKSPSILQSCETEETVYRNMWSCLSAGKEWRGELRNRRKNGEVYWANEVIAPILDAQGQTTHYVAIQEDITEAHRISEEITYQASHDKLTGLINRHEFERRLKLVTQSAHAERSEHALCFLDLDQFKVVNDTSGHIAGDELLQEISSVIGSQIRQRDTLARIGGDEFAILMEHCNLVQAEHVAEKIRHEVESFRFRWEDNVYTIGISIGITAIDERLNNSTDALKKADLACYAAKDGGRNRVHVYQPDDSEMANREGEMVWVNEVRRALDEDRFCLFVQPIISLADAHAATSYEILLRLETTDGKLHTPGCFLPAAERYNLSEQIDEWVIKHVLQWVSRHPEKMPGIGYFAINLSGQSLGNQALLEFIIANMLEYQIHPSKIRFEVTETAAISNVQNAHNFLATLKEHGCLLALDDFGSGLSSFAYLKNLPVDKLKIDGMFVKDIVVDPIDEAMVRSINDIGHVMGMETIAEFVENDDILQRLKEIGIDYAQGYGIGKPQPIDTLLEQEQVPRQDANC